MESQVDSNWALESQRELQSKTVFTNVRIVQFDPRLHYANKKMPVLDKVEKKFGGERFNNPDNHEKNQKLNDSIIKKLKQVSKIVM